MNSTNELITHLTLYFVILLSLQPGDVKNLIAVLFIICILSALTLPFSLSFVSHSSLHRYPLYHLYSTRPYISIFFIIYILPVLTSLFSLSFVSYPSVHRYPLYYLYPTRPYISIFFIIYILPVLTPVSSLLFVSYPSLHLYYPHHVCLSFPSSIIQVTL